MNNKMKEKVQNRILDTIKSERRKKINKKLQFSLLSLPKGKTRSIERLKNVNKSDFRWQRKRMKLEKTDKAEKTFLQMT